MRTEVACTFLALLSLGTGLKCYICNSADSKECGLQFNKEHFQVQECNTTSAVKCGTQIQEPYDDGWVGVLRVCYETGSIPGMKEGDGCQEWTNTDNYTATYCFCGTDGCNSGNHKNFM